MLDCSSYIKSNQPIVEHIHFVKQPVCIGSYGNEAKAVFISVTVSSRNITYFTQILILKLQPTIKNITN